MIRWLSSPEVKIVDWRQFRGQVTREPLKVGLKEVANLWRNCPKLQKPIFDIANVDNWPDPWQLLSQLSFCEYSQTLGIYYTLQMIEDFRDLNLAVETFEIAGIIQSRVRIDRYVIDLNEKQSIIEKTNDLEVKTLTKIIQ